MKIIETDWVYWDNIGTHLEIIENQGKFAIIMDAFDKPWGLLWDERITRCSDVRFEQWMREVVKANTKEKEQIK